MRDSDGADLSPEYTDPNMFIPKNTRVMVRKVNAKAQSAALKDAPEKQAALAAAADVWPALASPCLAEAAAGDRGDRSVRLAGTPGPGDKRPRRQAFVIASEPLDYVVEKWHMVPKDSILVVDRNDQLTIIPLEPPQSRRRPARAAGGGRCRRGPGRAGRWPRAERRTRRS